MTIDNFETLSKILHFNENVFFVVKIIPRTTDGATNLAHIAEYPIATPDDLWIKRDLIINLCELYNARAYITTNPISCETYTFRVFREVIDIIENKNFKDITDVWRKCRTQKVKDKINTLWLVDLDYITSEEMAKPYMDLVKSNFTTEEHDCYYIPTVRGCHLLVSPFNEEKFREKYPKINILKASATILYYKKKENNPE